MPGLENSLKIHEAKTKENQHLHKLHKFSPEVHLSEKSYQILTLLFDHISITSNFR